MNTLKAYRTSLNFLQKHGLSWFLWFPLIITFLVLFAGFSITSWATDNISEALTTYLESLNWLPDWTSIIGGILYWLLWIILRILLYFAFAFIGGSIILVLIAPVLTWLSEKVAVALGKHSSSFNLTQFVRDLTRAIGLAIRNGIIQFVLAMACLVLGFIPIIGLASPVLLFIINAYFYGYSFLDYSLERNKLSIQQSNLFAWKNKTTTLGLGIPFALWMLIPLIGPITAGFVALFSTIASTIETERLLEESKP